MAAGRPLPAARPLPARRGGWMYIHGLLARNDMAKIEFIRKKMCASSRKTVKDSKTGCDAGFFFSNFGFMSSEAEKAQQRRK